MVTEYELTDISRNQNDKFNKSGKHNTTTDERLADSSKQPKAQYNLQNPKANQASQGMEEEKLSYLIPTIINVQILRKKEDL